jgi:zinc protease
MILDRTIKPSIPSSLKFIPPKIESLILSNGLSVYFIPKDKLPLVRMSLIIDAGSKYDPQDKKGLAFLTSLAIDEGAGDLNALQLSDEFDLLGSSFNVSADNDSINITLQSLSENFERSFELFSKVILSPAFNSEDFEREKKKLLTRIVQSKDESDYIAEQIFYKIVLGEMNIYAHPVMGFEHNVINIEVNDAIRHYNDCFSPQNSFLIAAGNISKAELSSTLEKYLGEWKKETLINNQNITTQKSIRKIFLHHKEDAVQTEIRVGHLTSKRSNDDYFQRLMLNTILGGQFTSRINLNLRERNGYTYGANSRFQYFRDAAFFQISTSVGIENTINALKEIDFELNEIKKGVKESEVEFARSSITKKFPMNFETYRQIVGSVSTKIFFNLPDDYFELYIDKINSVTKGQIDEAAIKFIDNFNYSIVLVGDKNKLIRELKNIDAELVEVDSEGNSI